LSMDTEQTNNEIRLLKDEVRKTKARTVSGDFPWK
jgi:hypothetical protein